MQGHAQKVLSFNMQDLPALQGISAAVIADRLHNTAGGVRESLRRDSQWMPKPGKVLVWEVFAAMQPSLARDARGVMAARIASMPAGLFLPYTDKTSACTAALSRRCLVLGNIGVLPVM